MAQVITSQNGTASISGNIVSRNAYARDPVNMATAPSTGPSRVIINRLSLRNTGPANTLTSQIKLMLTIGQDSYGYSTIGGIDSSMQYGFISLGQASGDSSPTNTIGAGTGFSAGAVAGTSFWCIGTDMSAFTTKNLPAPDFFVRGGTVDTVNSIPTQFWVTPGDNIGVKLWTGSLSSGTPNFELTYSLIFITETP